MSSLTVARTRKSRCRQAWLLLEVLSGIRPSPHPQLPAAASRPGVPGLQNHLSNLYFHLHVACVSVSRFPTSSQGHQAWHLGPTLIHTQCYRTDAYTIWGPSLRKRTQNY